MVDPLIRSNDRICCVFVTVFWGSWHRGMFLNANLPTMLAPGNLPALAAGIDCEYLIYTTAKDAAELEGDPAFARLRSLLPVTIKLFTPSKSKHPITLHHDIWRQATRHAQQRGAFILLMPPDVAWADGSFAGLRAALKAGKRAIFMTYPRVLSETFVPAMIERFRPGADQSVAIPAPEMMALVITHLHPMMAAYSRSSSHFPIHPEFILWPIEGDGFLLRLLARELFCFEPGRYPLNAESLLAVRPAAEETHVFSDSRAFLGVSFTPLLKDAEWYLRSRRLEALLVGRWWMYYDSPSNDFISTFDLRFTCGTADETRWRKAERQAKSLLTHLRAVREFLRIEAELRRMGLWRAASFLTSALSLHGLARRWAHRGPFIVLVPTDKALKRAGFGDKLEDVKSTAEALRMIEAHVAVSPESSLGSQDSDLTTLAGRRFRLQRGTAARRCGDNLVVPIETVLYTSELPSGHCGKASAELSPTA